MWTNHHQGCRAEGKQGTLFTPPFESRRELITFLPGLPKHGRGWAIWMAESTQASLLEGFLKLSALWNKSGYRTWNYPECSENRPVKLSCSSGAASIPYGLPFGQQEAREHAPWSHQVSKRWENRFYSSNPALLCGADWRGEAHQTELPSLLRRDIPSPPHQNQS